MIELDETQKQFIIEKLNIAKHSSIKAFNAYKANDDKAQAEETRAEAAALWEILQTLGFNTNVGERNIL